MYYTLYILCVYMYRKFSTSNSNNMNVKNQFLHRCRYLLQNRGQEFDSLQFNWTVESCKFQPQQQNKQPVILL